MNIFLSAHPTTASTQDIVVTFIFLFGIFILYLLRKLPVFSTLWFLVRTFLLILLATLAWGYIKEKISEK